MPVYVCGHASVLPVQFLPDCASQSQKYSFYKCAQNHKYIGMPFCNKKKTAYTNTDDHDDKHIIVVAAAVIEQNFTVWSFFLVLLFLSVVVFAIDLKCIPHTKSKTKSIAIKQMTVVALFSWEKKELFSWLTIVNDTKLCANYYGEIKIISILSKCSCFLSVCVYVCILTQANSLNFFFICFCFSFIHSFYLFMYILRVHITVCNLHARVCHFSCFFIRHIYLMK